MKMRGLIIIWCCLAVVAVCAGRTITVDDDGPPADFNNIQAAINDANDSDTIIVAEGSYLENIQFNGKSIILTSTDPDNQDVVAATIIDGNDANSVVTLSGAEDHNCVLSGFTITNGEAPRGGGICGNSTMATIEKNIITGNISTEFFGAGGIFDCDGLIQNNIITDNHLWGLGGGLSECDGTIRGNTISDNGAYTGGGLYDCDGAILNNLIVGNSAVHGAGLLRCDGIISNCTVVGNSSSSALLGCNGTIKNCIIWLNRPREMVQIRDCSPPVYSCVENWEQDGIGNINGDPCFVHTGYWVDMEFYLLWVADDGDYHLKSQAGRWDPNSKSWIIDDVTSPCIDAGNPMSPIGYEPFPNGGIVNMGAYGGTTEASKSYFGGPLCEIIIAGDINGDCRVNFLDFRIMALHWLRDENRCQ